MKKLLTALLLVAPLLVSEVFAAPTLLFENGATVVRLAPEFTGALGSVGVTPSAIDPATLDASSGEATFPITVGSVDEETGGGEIFHAGGLGLATSATELSLLNFVITTRGDQGELGTLTGLAVVNGDTEGRIPLFDLVLTEPATVTGSTVEVNNVTVTLHETAAQQLNQIFGVSAFSEGVPVGTADTTTELAGALEGVGTGIVTIPPE